MKSWPSVILFVLISVGVRLCAREAIRANHERQVTTIELPDNRHLLQDYGKNTSLNLPNNYSFKDQDFSTLMQQQASKKENPVDDSFEALKPTIDEAIDNVMRETSDPELQILFIESYFKSIKDKIQEQSKLSNANDKKIFHDFIKKLERHINKKIKQIQDQINQDKAPLNEDLEPKSNIITPDSSSMQ